MRRLQRDARDRRPRTARFRPVPVHRLCSICLESSVSTFTSQGQLHCITSTLPSPLGPLLSSSQAFNSKRLVNNIVYSWMAVTKRPRGGPNNAKTTQLFRTYRCVLVGHVPRRWFLVFVARNDHEITCLINIWHIVIPFPYRNVTLVGIFVNRDVLCFEIECLEILGRIVVPFFSTLVWKCISGCEY